MRASEGGLDGMLGGLDGMLGDVPNGAGARRIRLPRVSMSSANGGSTGAAMEVESEVESRLAWLGRGVRWARTRFSGAGALVCGMGDV